MKVSLTAEPQVTFSMVYHVTTDGEVFLRPINTTRYYIEHIFAFVSGFTVQHINQLLIDQKDLFRQARLTSMIGITPKLFAAALLSQCGQISSPNMAHTARTLQMCNIKLLVGNSTAPKHHQDDDKVDIRAFN